MNPTRLPKEVLPDWARRDTQGTKGDGVQQKHADGGVNPASFWNT
jgi:hypothetical protein